MNEIRYETVNPFAFLMEMQELFPAHYEELCVTKDFPLVPDYDKYKQMCDLGMLKAVTVSAGDELIGYIIFIIQPHLHYKTCITAFEDIYYVKPEYRKGRIGIRLFQYAEKVLREAGVNRIIMHTKIHLDNSKLFEYLGYKHSDKIYTKIL
jgi:GNAT superfamily N-acetyltransferase